MLRRSPLGGTFPRCPQTSINQHRRPKVKPKSKSNFKSSHHLSSHLPPAQRTPAPSPTMADLHNTPIVIDNGSGTIRAGYAGEDLPKCFFPSFVGRPKHPRVLAGGLEGDTFIGNRAQELRGLLKIRYPLEHGIVTDWDDMERIWQYVYTDELKTLSEEVSCSGYLRLIVGDKRRMVERYMEAEDNC